VSDGYAERAASVLFSHLEMMVPPLALFVILALVSFRIMPLFLIWPPLFYPGLEKGAAWPWSTVLMRAVIAAGAVLVILLVGAPIVLCMKVGSPTTTLGL